MTVLHQLGVPGVDAVVSARAGALRLLRVDGMHLVEPTVDALEPPGMAGAVLAPWPNRVDGALWWHGGREERLEVTEPELGHANHGLLATRDFDVVRASSGDLVLETTIEAPPGYPFRLGVRVGYRLRRRGVDVAIAVSNIGTVAAPVAFGAHPYLRVGDEPADDLRVVIDGDRAYRLDASHIPRAEFAVAGSAWDLRRPRPLAEVPTHASFRRAGGRGLRHALIGTEGLSVEVDADPAFRFTQLYLADDFPADDGPRRAVAIEPMTAPPNGLRSGVGMRMLAPGRTWRAGFRVRLRQGRSRAR